MTALRDKSIEANHASGERWPAGLSNGNQTEPTIRQDLGRSNRSRFMTLSHAATKSRTNFSPASSHA
jgi:hypothetical protein